MEFFIAQIVALITFFAFPALQYILLRKTAKNEGNPELWYLPKYGFRLVIRNLPRKRTLSNIKYRALVRTIIPASEGSSVASYKDRIFLEKEDFFLFPGNDQVLISFQLHGDDSLKLIHTDKFGNKEKEITLSENCVLIADYTATINNWFNFDIHIAKRVELNYQLLKKAFKHTKGSILEQCFDASRVREVE
jgi:hypothetical protein